MWFNYINVLQIGLSPASPATFAYFGSYLAKLGDLSAGYRYALLGKTRLNKLGVHEPAGEVLMLVSHVIENINIY